MRIIPQENTPCKPAGRTREGRHPCPKEIQVWSGFRGWLFSAVLGAALVYATAGSAAAIPAQRPGGQAPPGAEAAKDSKTTQIEILTSQPPPAKPPPAETQIFALSGFRSQVVSRPSMEQAAQATGLKPVWLKSFGLVSLQLLSNGASRAQVSILEMIDPPGAYGLFTLAAVPPMSHLQIGDGARVSGDALIFWKGNYFFQVRGSDPATLEKWALALDKQLSYRGVLPAVVELLPRQSLDNDTVQFFVNDLIPDDGRLGEMRPLLGVDKSVQAAIGRYPSGERRLIILGYPTHALALESFERVKGYVTDKSHGVYAKRAGVVLALTEGIPREQAVSLLNAIHYTPSVKWIAGKEDRRPRGGGVQFLLGTVVGSLVLSALFFVGTAALGTAFGLFRFYLRRFRPDNFLDRPERVEVVRLKLVDK